MCQPLPDTSHEKYENKLSRQNVTTNLDTLSLQIVTTNQNKINKLHFICFFIYFLHGTLNAGVSTFT